MKLIEIKIERFKITYFPWANSAKFGKEEELAAICRKNQQEDFDSIGLTSACVKNRCCKKSLDFYRFAAIYAGHERYFDIDMLRAGFLFYLLVLRSV